MLIVLQSLIGNCSKHWIETGHVISRIIPVHVTQYPAQNLPQNLVEKQ
jgi:hypothetical protein